MTNFSRIVRTCLCLALLFSFSTFSVFPQELSASEQSEQNSSQAVPVDAAGAQNWNWNASDYEPAQRAPSTFALFLKMVFALAVVLVLAYLVVRVLRKGVKLSNSNDPFLRHVSHLSLSATRSVDVVTILDHAYILGVSDNAVNLIGEVTDKELVNSMNLYADKNDSTQRPRSFDDILSIFMPGGSRQNQNPNVYGSSARSVAEALERQRSRLQEEE